MAELSDRVDQDKATWGPLKALGGGFAALFIAQLAAFMIIELVPLGEKLIVAEGDPWAILVLELGIALIIGVIIYGLIHSSGGKLKQLGLQLKQPLDVFFKTAGVLVGYIAISIAVFYLLSSFVPEDTLTAEQDLGFDEGGGTFNDLFPIALSLIVVAPIIEEVLFRGWLFKGLRTAMTFWPAAIISSLLFAAIHMQLNVAVDVFIMALGAAWLLEVTKSLYAPILLHMTKNTIAFILVFVVGS